MAQSRFGQDLFYQVGRRLRHPPPHARWAESGPAYSAVLSAVPSQYLPTAFLPPSFLPPRWVLRIEELHSGNGGGYLTGDINSPKPLAARHHSDQAVHSLFEGSLGILDVTNNALATLRDFDSGAPTNEVPKALLPMSFEWMFRDSVFWFGNAGSYMNVGRWDQDAGSVNFIDYGPTHQAGALGTDGIDMVWVEGLGVPDGSVATADYWTSPYVTDKAQLKPRRLRSVFIDTLGGERVAVGCGRGVAYGVEGEEIVRLSDGRGWTLPAAKNWSWQYPLAITCDEVFMRVVAGPDTTIARVRFDQLGPGTPPD